MGTHDTISPILKLTSGYAGKREFLRMPIHAKTRICLNGDIIEGEVENLSMNGAYVKLDKQVKIDSWVVISIFDNATTSQTTFDIKAKVIWVRGTDAGMQFA